jgi:hypothetical protein
MSCEREDEQQRLLPVSLPAPPPVSSIEGDSFGWPRPPASARHSLDDIRRRPREGNPKVAGSNPAPAAMGDEGLAGRKSRCPLSFTAQAGAL